MEQKYPWVSSEMKAFLPTSVVLKSVLSVKVARGLGLILGLAPKSAAAFCTGINDFFV